MLRQRPPVWAPKRVELPERSAVTMTCGVWSNKLRYERQKEPAEKYCVECIRRPKTLGQRLGIGAFASDHLQLEGTNAFQPVCLLLTTEHRTVFCLTKLQ